MASRGKVLTLGEAYAFGVVWSFVFMSLSMLVLRFKRPGRREYEVPLNIRVGRFDVPLGHRPDLPGAGLRGRWCNLLTKEVATISGVAFTVGFFVVFWLSEHAHRRRRGAPADHHEHLEQFNQKQAEQLSAEALGSDQAVPQAGGDPLAVQPGDARAVPGRDRSRRRPTSW